MKLHYYEHRLFCRITKPTEYKSVPDVTFSSLFYLEYLLSHRIEWAPSSSYQIYCWRLQLFLKPFIIQKAVKKKQIGTYQFLFDKNYLKEANNYKKLSKHILHSTSSSMPFINPSIEKAYLQYIVE